MSFYSRSIGAAKSIVLRLLTFIFAANRKPDGRDLFQITNRRGRIVAYFSQEFIDLSISADTPVLSLGRSHISLIEISYADGHLASKVDVSITYLPTNAAVARIDAPSGTLRAWLIRLAFNLRSETLSVLDVKREMAVTHSNGSLALSAMPLTTVPGDWPEKYTRSVPRHLVHVIELAARRQASETFDFAVPLISFIVPVFNAKTEHLDDLLRSFRLQPPSIAELVFSDDRSQSAETIAWLDAHAAEPNVQIVWNTIQSGISGATNAGLAVARGTWVSFIDHDDALTPFGLGEIARVILSHPECAFLFTDEVITDENLVPEAYFLKPAWDPVLLSGMNYINHLSLYKRDLVRECGGLRSDFDGSQDYDLLLRYTSRIAPGQARHLPFPAYLWRRSGTTYSVQFLEKATRNARTSLAERFGCGEPIEVDGAIDANLHRIRFDKARKSWPKVSVIIPSRDAPELIGKLLQGLFDETDYPLLEVILIDNGTTHRSTLTIYDTYRLRPNFQVHIEPREFNFSAAVNKGLRLATGDLLLLLNNDIEVLSPDWLKEMVSCFDYDDVGIVGTKLIYPNGKLQHAGVIAGLGQLAGHWYIEEDVNFPGPMGRLWVRQTLSCVTGAVMLMSRTCADAVGSFDETNFAIAYNDVDFCLRATNAGFRVVWTPFALMLHRESASRGSDEAADKIERFRREQTNLRNIHATHLLEDRAFSPWYSRMYSHPTYLWRRDLPGSR